MGKFSYLFCGIAIGILLTVFVVLVALEQRFNVIGGLMRGEYGGLLPALLAVSLVMLIVFTAWELASKNKVK